MNTAKRTWLFAGIVLPVGGLVAILIAGQWLGLAPLLAGVGIVVETDLRMVMRKKA